MEGEHCFCQEEEGEPIACQVRVGELAHLRAEKADCGFYVRNKCRYTSVEVAFDVLIV